MGFQTFPVALNGGRAETVPAPAAGAAAEAASAEASGPVRHTTPLVLLAAARICEVQLTTPPEDSFTEGPVRLLVERLLAAVEAVEDGSAPQVVIEGPVGYEPMYLRPSNAGLARQQLHDMVGFEFPDLFYPGSTSPIDFLAIGETISAEAAPLEEIPINADVPVQPA